ncbi:MAG: 5'/3'-nucleotidase SurE [Spirochaetaceae bacterium]|jgi:5'-nucleotidase|nr:5'/3'-nucleotidase SurE [Spirochaetaceae bacterium]
MNLLLTNDDGIDAEAFLDFADALRRRTSHAVYVLAPDHNCSGASHALSLLRSPVRVARRAENIWTCSGTPADCVCVGTMGGLPIKPDMVLSGINAGPNIGTDLIYSGTAAAARQAALAGIPGIAFSLNGVRGAFYWKQAIDYAVAALPELHAFWTRDVFINVNIPNTIEGPGGSCVTFPSIRRYSDSLVARPDGGGSLSCMFQGGNSSTEPESGSDWDAVSRNHVSISPVFLHPVVRRDCCAGVPEYAGVAPRPDRRGGTAAGAR